MTLPIINQLHLLQLEQYSLKFYLKWNFKHRFSSSLPPKTLLQFTSKAKILLALSFLLFIFLGLKIVPISLLCYLILLFLFIFFPQPFLLLSATALIPFNLLAKVIIKHQIITELKKYPHLITIAITGSFGKTTVKNFLFQILDRCFYSVKTPHSYNTLFGIAKVIKQELNLHARYFICEMAAYKPGEINELTKLIKPQFAILTAIGSQHLERFGNLNNTTKAKFELIDSVSPTQALINIDNPHIQKHLLTQKNRHLFNTYSLTNSKATFYLKNYQFTPDGVSFTLAYQKNSYQFSSPIFGTSALEDLLAAVSMALILKIPIKTIQSSVASIKPAPHRLEIIHLNQAAIIDNTYSSNELGFTQIINDLKNVKGKKAIITPGLVELGSQSDSIHRHLGRLAASAFDTIILVGKASRTKSLAAGITAAKHQPTVDYLTDHRQYWPKVRDLSKNHHWILLENDLPENY